MKGLNFRFLIVGSLKEIFFYYMDLSNLKNNEKKIKRKNDYFKGKTESIEDITWLRRYMKFLFGC